MQSTKRVLAATLSACLIALGSVVGAAQERRTITVRSQDFGYYYYRVNTGNRVSLTQQLSRTACEYNRTWGYDYRGVWVDNGCEAEFEVGGGGSNASSNPSGNTTSDGRREIYVYSPNYNYYKYSVNTDNQVELVRQLSNSPCNQNSTWGYDGNGVWVDRGCSGQFLVGKRPGGSNAGRNTAIAGAVAGGVILAAILASRSHNNDKANDEVPDWLVGTFRGYNPTYDATVELTVYSGGSLSVRGPGMKPISGSYKNKELVVNDLRFTVVKQGNGIRTTQVGKEGNQVSYVRIY